MIIVLNTHSLSNDKVLGINYILAYELQDSKSIAM